MPQIIQPVPLNTVSYIPRAGNEKIRIVGSLDPIAGKWQISLFDKFSLHNVLHVPRISQNLLSISKVIHELNYKATFLPDSVSFQDLSSRRMIGSAQHNGVFTCLMMMPPLALFLGRAFYLPTLPLLKKNLCCDFSV